MLALALSLAFVVQEARTGTVALPNGSGGLTLAGRVLDPDGAPVYPFTLSAIPEGAVRVPAEWPLQYWDDARHGQRVTTGADGRFALHGLAPGPYALVGAADAEDEPELLSLARFEPGAGDVVLVRAVHRVVVRVRDHLGRPLALEELLQVPRDTSGGAPVLHCARRDALPADVPFREGHVDTFLVGDELVALAAPGTELIVGFASTSVPPVERTLVVPERPWRCEAELRLPAPVVPATMRLRVHGDLEGGAWLSLLTPSGMTVTPHARLRGGSFVASVPPGTYRVRVRPTNFLMCWQGDPEELVPRAAPAERLATFTSGAATDVALTVRGNARLCITLAGAARGEDLRGFRDQGEPLRRAVGGARVELQPADGSTRIAPEFSFELPELRLCVPWIAPGRACISISSIPPGRHRLLVTLADGRVLEREIELVENGSTDVELGP